MPKQPHPIKKPKVRVEVLERVIQYLVLSLVFLLPLWTLPFTQNATGYPKQALLALFVFLMVILWMANTLMRGKLELRPSWTALAVLVFVGVAGLSTIFSRWPNASLWGYPLDIPDGFVTTALLALFALALAHTTASLQAFARVAGVLLVSLAVATVGSVAQLYVGQLPSFLSSISLNPVGSIQSIALTLAVLFPLAVVLGVFEKGKLRLAAVSFLAVATAFLVMTGATQRTSWIVLIVGLLALLAFGMVYEQRKQVFGWTLLPMGLLVLSLFFLVFPVRIPGAPTTPVEVSLKQRAAFEIMLSSLKAAPVLGSGPATYQLEYAQFRPLALNQSVFWGTRFAAGASELLDQATTRGVLGMVALLLLLGTAVAFLGKKLFVVWRAKKSGEEENGEWMIQLGVFASLIGLIAALALYPFHLVLWLVFWTVMGGVLVAVTTKRKEFSISPPSLIAPVFSFVFLLSLIFGLGFLIVAGQRYAGEVWYKRAVAASARGDKQGSIQELLRSLRMNQGADLYWRDLSQLYLSRANELSGEEGVSAEDRSSQQSSAIQNAITAASEAVKAGAVNVANHNVRGFLYRNLIGVPGADQLALESYQQATALEPGSPFSYVEAARVYSLQADRLSATDKVARQELLEKALRELDTAVTLKTDYAPAYYLRAVVQDQLGNRAEAAAQLEAAKGAAPNDVGLAFQLGVLFWRKGDLPKAASELERARRISPNYSNARYFLGLVYDAQGDRQKARTEFQFVALANPDNKEVRKILANLDAGKPVLTGISTTNVLPQGPTPEEIKTE